MNIVLIGMRGSGKTTTGKILAKELGKKFIEMDDLVIQKARLSIPEIVKKFGWEKFRDFEEAVAKEVASLENAVIATGGGVVTRKDNIVNLKKKGVIIWLQAKIDTLLKRIGDDENRPSLTEKKSKRQEMEVIFNQRKKLYQQAADFIVDTERKTAQKVAEEIIKYLEATPGVARRDSPGVKIDAKTTLCCLIGNPVEHSFSPAIHNAAYQALGLNFVYLAFRVTDLKKAIWGIRALGIRGVSVTIPHKVAVLKYLDEVDKKAQEIGAVNTIVNQGGVLKGYNSDCEGAIKALEEKTEIAGKKTILLGAGGVACALAVGLAKKGAKVVVLNRTLEKAKRLARHARLESFGNLSNLELIKSADILINATSVGMAPRVNESLVPQKFLHPRLVVFDVVYNPKETMLIKDAQKVGAKVVFGDRMLTFQAAVQFELFTGQKAPIKVMEKALIKALERRS